MELFYGLKSLMQFLKGENIVSVTNLNHQLVLILLYEIMLMESLLTNLKTSHYPTCIFLFLLCIL